MSIHIGDRDDVCPQEWSLLTSARWAITMEMMYGAEDGAARVRRFRGSYDEGTWGAASCDFAARFLEILPTVVEDGDEDAFFAAPFSAPLPPPLPPAPESVEVKRFTKGSRSRPTRPKSKQLSLLDLLGGEGGDNEN